jgi:Holliday junction DNA helicase RuvA
MISSLNGKIVDLEVDSIVVDVGGVGLRVHVPNHLAVGMQVGQSVFLHTHLVVREDSLTLYGFNTREEIEFFSLLLGVNGVGPRLSLAILSALDPNAIRRAVFSDQPGILNNVSGVGKKTAQKIMLHLQDRITAVEGMEPLAVMDEVDAEVLEALTALGYSVVEAQAALQSIPKEAPRQVEERLRLALGYFTPPIG